VGTRFMSFNTNDYVLIRLTDFGRKIIKDRITEFPLNKSPEEDKDGWSGWQLHQVMNFFGEYLVAGGDLPFETTIRIPI
jgi:hypothetical protein